MSKQKLQFTVEQTAVHSASLAVFTVMGHVDNNVLSALIAPGNELFIEQSAVCSDDKLLCFNFGTETFYKVLVKKRFTTEKIYASGVIPVGYDLDYPVCPFVIYVSVIGIEMAFVAVGAVQIAFICYTDSVFQASLTPLLSMR